MKSNSFQKGFQLLHARGSMGVLLGAIWFFLAETGRKGDTPSSQNPMGGGVPGEGVPSLGSTWGGKRKRKARITLDSDSAEEAELWPPLHGRWTVS